MPTGYSGTPLVRKLGLQSKHRAYISGAPAHFAELLGPLPEDVRLFRRPAKNLDYVHLFVDREIELRRRFGALAARLNPAGMLWISWPKKASGFPTDLNAGVVRDIGLREGLVDVKVCAVDDVWSGLKFMIRIRDRPKP